MKLTESVLYRPVERLTAELLMGWVMTAHQKALPVGPSRGDEVLI